LAKIDRRTFRNDSGRIDSFDRPVIDDLVARLYRRRDAGNLIKLAHIIQKIGIIGDTLLVAFEQGKVGDIESHQRREQAPIRFGNLPADQIALPAEPRFKLVECCE